MWSSASPACLRASLLVEKGCVTAQPCSFINQRHFHCPCTATRLLHLSLADSSPIHLLGEGGTRCRSPPTLPVLSPSLLLLPKLLKPSQHEEYSGNSLEGSEHRAVSVQDPWLDSCMLGVLPSPLQGRCLCPFPKYGHKTPVCASHIPGARISPPERRMTMHRSRQRQVGIGYP